MRRKVEEWLDRTEFRRRCTGSEEHRSVVREVLPHRLARYSGLLLLLLLLQSLLERHRWLAET